MDTATSIDEDLHVLVVEGKSMRDEFYGRMDIPLQNFPEVFSPQEIAQSKIASSLPPPTEAEVNLWLHWRENHGARNSLIKHYRDGLEFVRTSFGENDSEIPELERKIQYLSAIKY